MCTLKSAPNKYGYRGLSLASVIGISQTVLITSRYNDSDSTWLKTFCNGTEKNICIVSTRPSKGTTVEIRGFLYNLNIQRKAINPINELQNIKSSLEKLSLIHCDVSISLRDDYKNKIIFKMYKKRDIYQTLWSLFDINKEDVQELQVEKNNYKAKAFIANENIMKTRHFNHQWVYLNGKFVTKSEIHTKINRVFKKTFHKVQKITKIKNNIDEDHNSDIPFYFIFISCPFYDFDITYKHKQTIVEFKDWSEKSKYIDHIALKFKNLTDSVRDRRKILSSEARNLIKKKESNTETIKITYTAEYNETYSYYKGKDELNIDYRFVSKTDIRDTHRIFDSETFKSLHPKITFDSHNCQNYAKTRNIFTKNLNCANTTDKIHLDEHDSNICHENLKRFSDNGCYDENSFIKYNNEQMSYTINSDTSKRIIISNNSYLNKYIETETNADKINLFDLIDKRLSNKSNLKTSYDKENFQNKRNSSYNKPYHALIADNIRQNNGIDLTYLSYKNYQKKYTNTVRNNTERVKSIGDAHYKELSQNFHSVNYCETIYHSNEISFVAGDLQNRNNCVKISPDDFKSPEQTHKENSNFFLLNNEDIHHDNNIFQEANTNTELHPVVENPVQDLNSYQFIKSHGCKKSNIAIYFDAEDFPNKDKFNLNETYSVIKTNNLRENNDVDLNLMSNKNYTQDYNQNEMNKTEIIDNKELSQSLDPMNYCETFFRRSEMSDIAKEFMNSFNINTNDLGSNECDPISNAHNENFKLNYSNDEKIQDEEKISQNSNTNSELHSAKRNCVEDLKTFELKKRHDLMPKGMSQVYKTRLQKQTNISISQIDYYENIMYDKFADDVFVKSKIFAPSIQNAEVNSRKLKNCDIRNDDLIFNATSLRQAKVSWGVSTEILGQIDRKFIATKMNGKKTDVNVDFLVLFDQHAVDERVKLERNLAEYFDGELWRSVKVDSIPLKLNENELVYLHNHRHKFSQFGLQWTFQENKISINSIPKAIIGKNARQEQIVLKAVHRLILEQIDVIETIGGNLNVFPKAIMDLVFSEACRNAIKFGDNVSLSDCTTLLKSLSSCKIPFQCAHGRPVMTVVMELPKNIRNYRVDKEKIKQFKSRKYNSNKYIARH
ncbi:MutL protein 1 [Danaus plexippus plexippus]|uniref:MutL protein 1 n=1 Tax=Danaus plexippus plexippus TaxID=278856 RepID=A0A212EIX6_DANPL|nr:MutL protein 1 [Danaus plexippus plexippus]